MDKHCAALCDSLAACIVKRDFAGAQALLAPWLRATLSADDLEAMVDAAADGLAHPPHDWSADTGLAGLEDLREPDPYGPPSRPLPPEVTATNFRGWLSIQFAPAPAVHEEQNVCYDLWLVAVEHEGRVLAGYVEAAEAS